MLVGVGAPRWGRAPEAGPRAAAPHTALAGRTADDAVFSGPTAGRSVATSGSISAQIGSLITPRRDVLAIVAIARGLRVEEHLAVVEDGGELEFAAELGDDRAEQFDGQSDLA